MVLDLSKLSAANGFVINGLAPGDILGVAPTNLGDVNGDGIDDFGVVSERSGPQDVGEAWVIFGRDGGFGAEIDLTNLGSGGFKVVGPSPNAQTNRMGAAGDLNNDGYADIAIGVSRDDPYTVGAATKYEGAVYVIYGGPDLGDDVYTVPVEDGFKFDGTDRVTSSSTWNTGEELGYSVGDRGDFNGDGIEDLILGSNGDDFTPGDAFILFGRADGNFDSVIQPGDLDGETGARFRGVNGNDATGVSTTLLDLNNDGFDDFAIGARNAEVMGRRTSGAVYVVLGGQDLDDGDIDLAESGGADGLNGFTLVGPAGQGAGWALDNAGDVNGDGIEDLIVAGTGSNGLRFPGDAGYQAPEAYVLFGSEDGFAPVIDLQNDLNGSNGFKITNFGQASWSHSFVAGVGDFNADGFDDLLIGADDTNGFKGQATVIYGREDFGATLNAGGIDGSRDGFVMTNNATIGELGNGTKGAGDINNDGVADLLVGSNWSDTPGLDAGQMFALYGFKIDVPSAISIPLTDDYSQDSVTLAVTVSLSAPAINPVTLSYMTLDGTAVAGEDYDAASGSVSFGVGEVAKTIFITVQGNDVGEAEEAFTLRLFNADGAGFGDTATADIAITIPNNLLIDNTAPIAQDDLFTVDEDTALTGDLLADNGAGADRDPDEEPLSITAVNGEEANLGEAIALESGGMLTVNGDGTFDYTPAADFNGTETFTYRVSDTIGTTDTASVTIEVAPVNDDPVAQGDLFTGMEDNPVSGDVLADNGTGADSDLDGDALLVSLAEGPGNGTVDLNEDGTFIYTPDADFFGADSFVYALSDGTVTETATVTIVIDPDNDAPLAQDDAFLVRGAVSLMGDVLIDNGLGADSDPEGDPLTVAILAGPAHASAFVLAEDGGFGYTAEGGFTGTDSFTYTLSDSAGGTDTATVTIVVDQPITEYAISTDAPDVVEGGTAAAGSVVVTVTRSGDVDMTGSVDYALSGDASGADLLSPLSGTLAFAAGQTEQTISFLVNPDRAPEADEAFTVTLSNAQAETGEVSILTDAVTVTILDDDLPTLVGSSGADNIKGTAEVDIVDAGDGNDKVKTRGADDYILGGAGNDRLDGGDGDDLLFGGDGVDLLKDKRGNNVFDGGAGADTLQGGKGDDVFIFTVGSGADLIKKFGQGDDVIDLTGFAGLTFESFTAQAIQDGKHVVFDAGGGDVLTIAKVSLEDLDAGSFLFA